MNIFDFRLYLLLLPHHQSPLTNRARRTGLSIIPLIAQHTTAIFEVLLSTLEEWLPEVYK